jgi:hypothetical protein
LTTLLVEHGVTTVEFLIKESADAFLAGLPLSFVREWKGGVPLDALG